MIRNQYLDSLKLLKRNKIVIDRLSKRLVLMEQETSSIASELDAIETKISPMLSQHVPSYEVSISCSDDTSATCTATTLSKTLSPDRNDNRPSETDSVHRYINLSDFDGECLLGDMDSVSGLFSSDLSSISKCPSIQNVSVNHDTTDEVEVFIKRDGWHSLDGSNVQQLLNNRQEDDDSYMVSLQDDLSAVSALSDLANHEGQQRLGNGVFTIDEASFHPASEASKASDNESTTTFERTGRRSHLYAFPEDACCLFGEPSQDLTIPACAEDEEDSPCFILGIKSRSEDDECGCIIC